jgi:hypothetical protein
MGYAGGLHAGPTGEPECTSVECRATIPVVKVIQPGVNYILGHISKRENLFIRPVIVFSQLPPVGSREDIAQAVLKESLAALAPVIANKPLKSIVEILC